MTEAELALWLLEEDKFEEFSLVTSLCDDCSGELTSD